MCTVVVSLPGSGTVRTRRPFASRYSVTPSIEEAFWGACGEAFRVASGTVFFVCCGGAAACCAGAVPPKSSRKEEGGDEEPVCHDSQSNRCSLRRPEAIVAKLRRERHARTPFCGAGSGPRGARLQKKAARELLRPLSWVRGSGGLFLVALPLLADAALQVFAGLAFARLADLVAARDGFLEPRLALGRVLARGAHLVAHAIAPFLALLALAGLVRLVTRGLELGDALLAGLGVFRLRAVDAPFALRLRRIGGRLGENRGAERQHHGREEGPEHGGSFRSGR